MEIDVAMNFVNLCKFMALGVSDDSIKHAQNLWSLGPCHQACCSSSSEFLCSTSSPAVRSIGKVTTHGIPLPFVRNKTNPKKVVAIF